MQTARQRNLYQQSKENIQIPKANLPHTSVVSPNQGNDLKKFQFVSQKVNHKNMSNGVASTLHSTNRYAFGELSQNFNSNSFIDTHQSKQKSHKTHNRNKSSSFMSSGVSNAKASGVYSNNMNMSFIGDDVSQCPTSAGLPPSAGLKQQIGGLAKQKLNDFIKHPLNKSVHYNPFEQSLSGFQSLGETKNFQGQFKKEPKKKLGSSRPSIVHNDENNHHRPKSSMVVEQCKINNRFQNNAKNQQSVSSTLTNSKMCFSKQVRPKSGQECYPTDQKNQQSLSVQWRNRYDSTLELTGKDMNEIKPTQHFKNIQCAAKYLDNYNIRTKPSQDRVNPKTKSQEKPIQHKLSQVKNKSQQQIRTSLAQSYVQGPAQSKIVFNLKLSELNKDNSSQFIDGQKNTGYISPSLYSKGVAQSFNTTQQFAQQKPDLYFSLGRFNEKQDTQQCKSKSPKILSPKSLGSLHTDRRDQCNQNQKRNGNFNSNGVKNLITINEKGNVLKRYMPQKNHFSENQKSHKKQASQYCTINTATLQHKKQGNFVKLEQRKQYQSIPKSIVETKTITANSSVQQFVVEQQGGVSQRLTSMRTADQPEIVTINDIVTHSPVLQCKKSPQNESPSFKIIKQLENMRVQKTRNCVGIQDNAWTQTIQSKLYENILDNDKQMNNTNSYNSGFVQQMTGDTFHHAYVSRSKVREYPQQLAQNTYLHEKVIKPQSLDSKSTLDHVRLKFQGVDHFQERQQNEHNIGKPNQYRQAVSLIKSNYIQEDLQSQMVKKQQQNKHQRYKTVCEERQIIMQDVKKEIIQSQNEQQRKKQVQSELMNYFKNNSKSAYTHQNQDSNSQYKRQMATILKSQLKERRISMMDIDKRGGVIVNQYGSNGQYKEFRDADKNDTHIMSKINLGLEVPHY